MSGLLSDLGLDGFLGLPWSWSGHDNNNIPARLNIKENVAIVPDLMNKSFVNDKFFFNLFS